MRTQVMTPRTIWLCVVGLLTTVVPWQVVAVAAPTPDVTKNVLFIVSDDLKASVLGCYGDKVCKTPNIDRLAREGLVFDRAFCQGTVCGPSRQSFMFSKYRGKGSVNLGQHFKDNGWYSARVGKIYHMKVPGDIIAGTNGQDVPESWTERFNSPGQEAHTPGEYACLNLNIFTKDLEDRQSTAMPHRMFVSVRYEGDGADQPDHKSASKAIKLLRQHKGSPFFLAVGLVRPHYPMVAPEQYFTPYRWQNIMMPESVDDDLDDIPKLGLAGTLSSKNPIGQHPDNQKRMWAAYYAAVAFMDEQVGRMLDELERLGLRDSTTVVFLSDHGYHLGEHTFWQKNNLHEEVTRVPLIMSVPGYEAGRTDSIVELVDLFPTLSELAGLAVPGELHGTSLVPILKSHNASVNEGALSFVKGQHISWRTRDYAYMQYKDGSKELYDMNSDPEQFTNAANNPRYADVVKEMAVGLETRLSEADLRSNN
ncbi:MAG: sulfatase [Planctomycetes bacterium]|nr:sulfatase [Planctomycetota bacterium]